MKKCIILFNLFCIIVVSQAQSYKNPVIPGFYPDPSVCRVDSNYYLVNSSFEYFPGIPIWESKDLIHWKQIGNVLDRTSQLPLNNCKPSNGIYAPTIRYNNGVYYVVVTNVGNDRKYNNFYVTSKNPQGPWSEPIFYDQNGIDPSLFFDNDGKVYFLSNRANKPTDERAIYQSEIDIKTGKRLGDIKQIWKGSGGSYVEGPHMYKKDGYYYLMTAEGGTSYGHTVAISRSKNIWGPFDSCPTNPILTNRMSYSSIQGTGHADLVQALDSSWWMVHLAFRPAIDGIHFIGRETCLTPVVWSKGEWPIVNFNGQTDENIFKVPFNFQSNLKLPFNDIIKYDFTNTLEPEWLYLRNPDSLNYNLSKKSGWLSLTGSQYTLDDLASPTLIAKRQQHFNFSATTLLQFYPKLNQEEAGLTLLMDNRFHYDCFIVKKGNQRFLNLRYTLDSLKQVLRSVPIPDGDVTLQIKGDKKNYTFFYKINEESFHPLGVLNTRFLGTEVSGGYNGVVIGLYATGNGIKNTSTADFDWFEYKPL